MEIIMVGIGLIVFGVVQYVCIMWAIKSWSLKKLDKLDEISRKLDDINAILLMISRMIDDINAKQ
jgi:hypothetical protein